MSKTKQRILDAALQQFNELGTDAVTVRSVADAVGISHGNLCYHFKNTDVLIEALYQQLVEEIGAAVFQMQTGEQSLRNWYVQVEATCRLLYQYRFLLLDFTRICRRLDTIRSHFRQLMVVRRQQMSELIATMVENGRLQEPWIESQYDTLISQVLLMGDAWIPHAEIHSDLTGEPLIRHYSRLFFSMLAPYLTEKGEKEYRGVMG